MIAARNKKRTSWNKGYTKLTHLGVAKISETLKKRKIDNFRQWRDEMKARGRIKSIYSSFPKNGDLAELIGVVLGDGHIEKFPRTQRLTISSHSENRGFIKRYALLAEKIIGKKPKVKKQKVKCVKIYLYEKYLSKRLGIPAGNKGDIVWQTPKWILGSKQYLIRYLRGL
ncbi:hypothetical protein ACFL5U_03975, partial [Candidatus Margulisiibacteriota bacterium]